MKGIVFVELLAMAEKVLGEDTVDEVIESANLASGGAYTSVGNYPCAELVALVDGFSRASSLPPEDLQRRFGHWMMDVFRTHYGVFFKDKASAFQMLDAIEAEIHVEVRKLYPDADLPQILTRPLGADGLEVVYRSANPLQHFCHGLIEACLSAFDEKVAIDMQDFSRPDASHAVFALTRI